MKTEDFRAKEAVGRQFSLDKMRHARTKTFEAVNLIATQIHPGMTEKSAKELAARVLAEMGMDRIWHGIIIRFGHNTLKKFNEKIDPESTLGENDIFFIDLGVVWDGHEGDAGNTFVVGVNPSMQACAQAARDIWFEAAQIWQKEGATGEELYVFASERAEAYGWQLNVDVKGHRISDFPHAIHKGGNLGDFALKPDSGVWVLEIQLADPAGNFGAFYEDILV